MERLVREEKLANNWRGYQMEKEKKVADSMTHLGFCNVIGGSKHGRSTNT
jgi:hypothetical protein